MRIFLPVIAILLYAQAAFGWWLFHYYQSVGGSSYIFEENFESPGFENTWGTAGDTVTANYATSPAPLLGSYSLYMERISNTTYADADFTAQSEVWGHARIIVSASNEWEVIYLRDASDNDMMAIAFGSGNTIRVASGTATASVTTLAYDYTGTVEYHVWWHYTEDSGAGDGAVELWVGTSTTRPGTSLVSLSTGDAGTADVSNIRLRANSPENPVYFDQIIIHNSEFTTVSP